MRSSSPSSVKTCGTGLRTTAGWRCASSILLRESCVIRFVVSESPSPFAISRPIHGPAVSLRNTALCIWSAPTESIFYKPATTTDRWPHNPMKLPVAFARR